MRCRRGCGRIWRCWSCPARNWIPAREADGQPVYDVVVVGAGMCGLTACAAMMFMGIRNVVVLDAALAGQEGPWVNYARMRTLRSPKVLTGPALGQAALTFQAYYQARFGVEAWAALGKIPRGLWMDYLVWYRQVLELPVRNGVRVTGVDQAGPGLLAVETTQGRVLARRLVLATGRDGLGGQSVPPITAGLDRRFWAHSAEDIDFAALRGRAVGVVGAGASAMDNAATALEAGAGRVDLFIRRADIPRVNKFTGIGSPGVVNGFAALEDAWKWKFLHYVLGTQTPPPRDSTLRASQHENARFHVGSPILRVVVEGDGLRVTTPKGEYRVDFLIFATGFALDPAQRPEFGRFLPHVRVWGDRYAAPPGLESGELAESPDLGPAFEFQERTPGDCPWLGRIHCFNHHATLSHGKLAGDIPAVSDGAQRLARGLAGLFFAEDQETHYARLQAFDTPELLGDEWTDADSQQEI